jgi:hypothetical protein
VCSFPGFSPNSNDDKKVARTSTAAREAYFVDFAVAMNKNLTKVMHDIMHMPFSIPNLLPYPRALVTGTGLFSSCLGLRWVGRPIRKKVTPG